MTFSRKQINALICCTRTSEINKNCNPKARPTHLVKGKGLLLQPSVHRYMHIELPKYLAFGRCSKKIAWMNKYLPFQDTISPPLPFLVCFHFDSIRFCFVLCFTIRRSILRNGLPRNFPASSSAVPNPPIQPSFR